MHGGARDGEAGAVRIRLGISFREDRTRGGKAGPAAKLVSLNPPCRQTGAAAHPELRPQAIQLALVIRDVYRRQAVNGRRARCPQELAEVEDRSVTAAPDPLGGRRAIAARQ